jgi:hypothetical protein
MSKKKERNKQTNRQWHKDAKIQRSQKKVKLVKTNKYKDKTVTKTFTIYVIEEQK